ncbi:MAG: ABC transporter ATP-binding protein [Carboxylicivirga sp.]|jgi:putative ABC transport system ATP-binding protein|nr:ABC transporter ATP-binding protein [Carboxylicivirga sp.]
MIVVHQLEKTFRSGKGQVTAVDNVSLNITNGSFTLVKGPSGCGKSTLLFTIGGMLKPSSGSVLLGDKDLYKMNERQRVAYRSNKVGYVFQSNYLIPYLTLAENILMVNKVKGVKVTMQDVEALLEDLNLSHRLHHKPSELSVGEKQRAGLARALIIQPDMILADEPTGNLDPDNANQVLEYLDAFRKQGGTVVMVTHGTSADHLADRIIIMKDGNINQIK